MSRFVDFWSGVVQDQSLANDLAAQICNAIARSNIDSHEKFELLVMFLGENPVLMPKLTDYLISSFESDCNNNLGEYLANYFDDVDSGAKMLEQIEQFLLIHNVQLYCGVGAELEKYVC